MESASSSTGIDWQQAIATHRRWLRKVLRSRVGDWHAVDDLMQEISLAVVQQSSDGSIGSVPSERSKIAPFLYRVAIRKAANFHRKANQATHAKPFADESAESNLADDRAEPLDWLLKQEQRISVAQAIESLDEEYREILILKYTEKWSYQQLAAHLGVSTKAVERRLARARSKMRSSLEKGN